MLAWSNVAAVSMILSLLVAPVLAVLPHAPVETEIWVGGFQSVLTLGSEDLRFGIGAGARRLYPGSRIRLFGKPRAAFLEAYVSGSHGGGDDGSPRDVVYAAGALGGWRYSLGRQGRLLGEIGWGLQWANGDSLDLENTINSTPFIGLIHQEPGGRFIGLRLLHISNGGMTRRQAGDQRNQGQNQLFLVAGWRL